MRSPWSAGALFPLVVLIGACSQGETPADPKLWTLFDVQALYAGGASETHGLAPNDGLPGGIPLGQLLSGSMLVGRDAWADDYLTSYVTTEVWSNFDRVWMQPAYVPVTGWSGGVPQKLLDGGAWHPIFGVGPASAFYSPFWQIVYADVPADTAPSALTSARQILDGGYRLTPSEGRTMPLAPDGIMGGVKPPGTGWLDGAPVSFLDFGTATFTWDEANVVQEIPLYVFTVVGNDGQPRVMSEMPKVLGTAPPGRLSGPPPNVGGDGVTPRYSAYWRIYTVPVPPFATIFAPPDSPLAADLLGAGISPPGTYPPDIVNADPNGLAPFVGRVAVDMRNPATGLPDCFTAGTLASCQWIQVQADLEAKLDVSTNQATGITVTCPVIEAQGSPVVPL